MTTAQYMLGDVTRRLSELPAAKFACCVTSPPFWGRRAYLPADWREIGRGQTIAEYISCLRLTFVQVRERLRDDGILWLNLGDTAVGSGGAGGDYLAGGAYAGRTKYRQGKPELTDGTSLARGQWADIPGRVAHALQRDGWLLRAKIVWVKPSPRREAKAHVRRPGEQHELIYMLTKRKASEYRYFPDGEIEPGDVWHMATSSGADNGKAPFPVELPRRCIALSSEPGDWILDPFAGSGATLIAALEGGRNVVGIDLDPSAAILAVKRIDRLPDRRRFTVHVDEDQQPEGDGQ